MSTAVARDPRSEDSDERPLTREQLAVALAIDAFGIRAWRLAAPVSKAERRTPQEHRRALVRRRG
jgi:hypothetical protein